MSETTTALHHSGDTTPPPSLPDGTMELELPVAEDSEGTSAPKRAASEIDQEDGQDETTQPTVDVSQRKKLVAKRIPREKDEIYMDFVRTTLAMKPLPTDDAEENEAPDLNDGTTRKRPKPGSFANQDTTKTGSDLAKLYLDPDSSRQTTTIKQRKPTAFSNNVLNEDKTARIIAPEMTNWAHTEMDLEILVASAFEDVDASLTAFLSLREEVKDGKLEASLVPGGGNQGPHTIAHVMTGNLMWVSLPSVFPKESDKSKDLAQLPSNQIFAPGKNVPEALRIWAEIEHFWMGFDLPSKVCKIVEKETRHAAASVEPEKAKQIETASQKLLLSYTEWFNRIEALLTEGYDTARAALEKASPDDKEALQKIANTARDQAKIVAQMIHHLWTVHPYASYCWQDGEEPDDDEIGGKGERGKKFVEPHRAFLEALDKLSNAPFDDDTYKKYEQARQELARNMGDMIDPYTMDHVKDAQGYWDYLLGFCQMIDPQSPEVLLKEVKARLSLHRQVGELFAKWRDEGRLNEFIALSETHIKNLKTEGLQKLFPELVDEESVELFKKKLRSASRKNKKK